MALKVYGIPPSPSVGIAVLTAYEKGVDFEMVLVELNKKEHKAPDYLLKHPFGRVPCIDDGDFTLFESRAIGRYLSEKYAAQGTDIYPKEPAQRGAVDQWIEVQAHWFDIPAAMLAGERFFAPKFFGRPCNDAVAAENFEKLEAALDIYEAHLSKNKYFAGDFFSLADIVHMPTTRFVEFAAPSDFAKLFTSRKHVREWWADVSSRPSWKKYDELSNAYVRKAHPEMSTPQ